MKKKGQASIEFLFTYGWAILAVTITIGALSYFNILSPERFVNPYCDFGSQFDCLEFGVYDNGTMVLFIRNNHRVDIKLVNISLRSELYDKTISIGSIVARGNVTTLTLDLDGSNLRSGDVHRSRANLAYQRAGGASSYSVSGNIFTSIIPSN